MLNGKKVYVIIGAAGSGKRMAVPIPKQFHKIKGKTILEHTVEKFAECTFVDKIILVTAEDYQEFCRKLFADLDNGGRLAIVSGGKERQDSVYSAIKYLTAKGADSGSIVLIHDGVRPFVSKALIQRVCENAMAEGSAIPAVAPKDTIRHIDEGTLDRGKLCCVQTPQGFRFDIIEKAFEKALADGFYGTDDASLVERTGHKVSVVEGEYTNIKITTPEDLTVENRIGTGFDVHRLTEERKLILGGVEIPFEKGLLGHSDADVLVHALMDAMLGAGSAGDIGKLFPDSDDKFRGISSLKLLAEVAKVLSDRGYSFGNADMTIICQRPKLAPYIDEMRRNIAEVLNVPEDKISIKATTTEKLGFTGRGEGIAVEAVCLLNR